MKISCFVMVFLASILAARAEELEKENVGESIPVFPEKKEPEKKLETEISPAVAAEAPKPTFEMNSEKIQKPEEILQNSENIPKAEENVQKAEENVQKAEENVQKAEEKVQKVEEIIQKAEEKVQKAEEKIQKSEGNIQKSVETIKNSEDNIQKSEDIIHKAEDIIQKAEDNIQKSRDNILKTEDNIQKSEITIQKSEEAIQKVEQMKVPTSLEATGEMKEVVPQVENLNVPSVGHVDNGLDQKELASGAVPPRGEQGTPELPEQEPASRVPGRHHRKMHYPNPRTCFNTFCEAPKFKDDCKLAKVRIAAGHSNGKLAKLSSCCPLWLCIKNDGSVESFYGLRTVPLDLITYKSKSRLMSYGDSPMKNNYEAAQPQLQAKEFYPAKPWPYPSHLTSYPTKPTVQNYLYYEMMKHRAAPASYPTYGNPLVLAKLREQALEKAMNQKQALPTSTLKDYIPIFYQYVDRSDKNKIITKKVYFPRAGLKMLGAPSNSPPPPANPTDANP